MNRRHFLRAGGLAAIASPAGLAARAVDEAAIDRYCEVVKRVEAQWYPRSSTPVRSLAMRAIAKDAVMSLDRTDAAVRGMLRIESARRRTPEFIIAEQALRRFIDSLDPWSEYLDYGTWKQYQASQSSTYCGVGMDLEKEANGSFTCWPYPGSVADRAGLRPGARLVAVDGHPITGMSLYAIGAKVRGPAGRPVRLTVAGAFPGSGKDLGMIRRPTHSETVFPYNGRHGPGVRISRFGRDTPSQLAQQIRRAGPGPVEIDLRDCRGGDLDAAVECAALFLRAGDPVGGIGRVRGGESLKAGGGTKLLVRPHLLQNGNTASSAELFIRALTAHHAAVSSGSRTKGKGTTQSIIPLDSGGAIVLTTGLIIDPFGASWHQTGLAAAS